MMAHNNASQRIVNSGGLTNRLRLKAVVGMRKYMRPFILLCLVVGLSGCASIDDRFDAARNAVDNNLISGLSSSNKFFSTFWQFPSAPIGPYSDISGFSAIITEGPNKDNWVALFLGKTATGNWEVFAAMLWMDNQWKTLPVKLPENVKTK